MHGARFAPGAALALALLAAVAIAGCTSGSAPVASTSSQPASLAASASPAATTPAATSSLPSATASAPAVTSSAAPSSSGAVQNLIVSPAVRSELLAAYAAFRNIPVSDVRGVPGSVYYADVPATATYWAEAHYEPASGDSLTVQVGFQDGGGDAFYKKTGSGAWQVSLGGEPVVCAALKFFPLPVLAAWSLPTSATPASMC